MFDLDGVLVHSMPLHVTSWEQYLAKLGIQVKDLERRMHGRRNMELVRDLIDPNASDEQALAHGAAKERLFRELMGKEDPAAVEIAGAEEFLERYWHVPKTLASNAERANIDFVLDHLKLRPFFEVVVDGQQVERPKPYPDIYLKAAAQLGVRPEACIVFEDSPAGAKAGIDAGMRVVGVESTPTQFDRIAFKVKDFRDSRLDRWLEGQGIRAAALQPRA